MVGWFANNVVGAMLKDWIAGEMKKLAMKLGFLGQEKGAQVTASGEIMGTKGAEATAVAGANAVEAGTGAAAAVAPIPFIGPVMALAAMASVFAAVMAMSSRKSAARGYDIPKGLNPLVQTHEEEMILPSEHANTIRSLAELARSGNLGGDGGSSNVVNYHDHSGKLSDKEIKEKAHVIAREMSRMARNFYWVGKK